MCADWDPGFAILPGVFSSAEMETLSTSLSAAALPRSRAGARNALSSPALATFAHDARLLRIASAILGDEAFAFRATLFDESRRSSWPGKKHAHS